MTIHWYHRPANPATWDNEAEMSIWATEWVQVQPVWFSKTTHFKSTKGWISGSKIEHFLDRHEDLGLIPRTTGKEKREGQGKRKRGEGKGEEGKGEEERGGDGREARGTSQNSTSWQEQSESTKKQGRALEQTLQSLLGPYTLGETDSPFLLLRSPWPHLVFNDLVKNWGILEGIHITFCSFLYKPTLWPRLTYPEGLQYSSLNILWSIQETISRTISLLSVTAWRGTTCWGPQSCTIEFLGGHWGLLVAGMGKNPKAWCFLLLLPNIFLG